MDLIIFSSCQWRYQCHVFDNSKLGCITVQEKCSWSRRHRQAEGRLALQLTNYPYPSNTRERFSPLVHFYTSMVRYL